MITIHLNFHYKDVNALLQSLWQECLPQTLSLLGRIYTQLLNQFIIFLITFPLSSIKRPCNSKRTALSVNLF